MCEFDARRMNGSPSQLTEYKVRNFDLFLQALTLLTLEVKCSQSSMGTVTLLADLRFEKA